MKVTKHAAQRWAERFPGRDMATEYGCSRITSDDENEQILKECPKQRNKRIKPNEGFYYKVTDNAVFAVGGKQERILTVFPRSF